MRVSRHNYGEEGTTDLKSRWFPGLSHFQMLTPVAEFRLSASLRDVGGAPAKLTMRAARSSVYLEILERLGTKYD